MSDKAGFDYAALFEENDEGLLDSILGDTSGEPEEPDIAPEAPAQGRQPQQEPPPPRQQQKRAPSGGFQVQIARLTKEIEDLEKKIDTHRETGAYVVKASNGEGSVFDHVALQEDIARMNSLSRRLGDTRERAREARETSETQAKSASRFAQEYLKREIQHYPEEMRKRIAEKFVATFRELREQGTWSNPMYQDREKLAAGLQSLMNTVLGGITREQYRKDGHRSRSSGYEEGDEQSRDRPRKDEDDDDEFTKQLMSAYQSRKSGSMSIAERKRQERQERADAEQRRQGGNDR